MSRDRGNQIAIRHHWLSKFKKEYIRRDLSDEKLQEIRDNLDNYKPDSYEQAREFELRIQAINELLNDV